MDYCSLEDAWGVKSFRTLVPQLNAPPRASEPNSNGKWPVSGPFGYRAHPQDKEDVSSMHPVTMAYMQGGVDGVLMALPANALDELRSKLMVGQLNIVAGVLLLGFVLLILWDVMFKRR